ncbi:hypothetical protein PR202_ga23220 [Eleusine coracana subsp. coracana]|uniref:WRKY transcription factor n=1 Tax=Eleusine coracana subsp. coracana TaxID=191504 RepID=A0AAV5D3P6_ELECO|nr:hypothetical protein PR202_ga23220 [Eleusine coracana subsp. coracana]
MEVAIERPPVKEEKMSHEKPEEITAIGRALPIVFESFQSVERSGSSKQQDESSLEAAKAEMGVVRQENERLKSMLSRVVSEYQSLQTHFLDVVKQGREQQANKPLPPEEATAAAPPPVADDADDLVSLSLGTRTNNNGGRRKKGGHERSSSSSGTAGDDSQLSLGLGFTRPSTTTDDEKAGPVLNLSSDSSGSADDTAKQHAGESRKSPSGGGGGDDEVQQQAKKTRVSVRVKCDTPTVRVNNGFSDAYHPRGGLA